MAAAAVCDDVSMSVCCSCCCRSSIQQYYSFLHSREWGRYRKLARWGW